MSHLAWLAKRFSSVRARFLLLVLLVLAAPVGTLLFSARQERRQAASEAAVEALRWSGLAAVEYQQRLEAAHQFLEVLAELPAVDEQNGEACSQLAGRLLKKYSLYTNVSAARPDGRVFCSALPAARNDNWAQQRWFQQALTSVKMVVGDYQIDPATGVPVLTMAHPARDDLGQLQAVTAVSLPVDWLARYAAGQPSFEGRNLTILDQAGTVLLRYPEPERWIGQRDTVEAFLEAIRQTPEAGNVEGTGIDGIRRLYAYTRLAEAPPGEQRYLRVGLPATVAYEAADRQLRQNLALLAAAAAVALLGAWWVGGLLVLHPLGSLLQATSGLRHGDLAARTGPPYASGELGQLAQAFDGMAEALAARAAERQRAEAEVRALNAGLERRVAERTEQLEAANRTLTRYAEEQSTLYGVSAAIAGALEPQELLAAVVEIVVHALAADAGWVLVADRVMGARRSVPAWKGVSEEFVRAEADVPPETCPACELLLGKGQFCCEPNVMDTCPRLSPAILSAEGLGSHVSLPLISAERVLGILNVGWHAPHSLSSAERALMATIGRQLCVALEKAELYAAATRRARRLAVMNGIGQALTQTLDLDSVLSALLQSVMPAVEAGAAGVALLEKAEDDETGPGGDLPDGHREPALVYRQAAGAGAERVVGRQAGAAESLAGQALATRKKALQPAPSHGGAVAWRDGRLTGGDQVCLPLIAGERMIGVLELAKGTPEGLDGEDLQLLEAVAAQAAVAIENALLYQRQRAQYRRLEESQAQLVQAEKSAALGGLAAALAHEINNPLQSLRGHIEMVTDFPLEQAERSQYLQIARQEILRLSEIAHRTLNFYRPSESVRLPVQVNALLEQTLLLAGKQLERAHIEVSLDLANSQLVMAVPDQLMQVFLNVLINAVQAIQGSGHIHIATSSDREGVVISFTNDGPPITPDHLARVFAPNFTTKLGGTGLGLFIARNIIQQHSGTIVAQNLNDATGVVFTIRLPIARPAIAEM